MGVVLYLLLVGHNPFNVALRQPNQNAVDQEVLRLAALGNFNVRSERWARLPSEAHELISAILKVAPAARLSSDMALRHPFFLRYNAAAAQGYEASLLRSPPSAPVAWADLERVWSR